MQRFNEFTYPSVNCISINNNNTCLWAKSITQISLVRIESVIF